MKLFNSIGHVIAWVLSKLKEGASAAEAVASSPLGEALAKLAGGKGGQVQADIEAIAGSVVAAAAADGAALTAGFLNGALDAAALEATKRLVETVGHAFGKGPAAPPAVGA